MLRHRSLVLLIFAGTICLNVALFVVVPKGLFPQQDTGRLFGWMQADQSVSFQAMSEKLRPAMTIVQQDPAVESVVGFTGAGSGWGGSSNTATVFASLKPLSQRPSIDQVIERLRPKLAQIPSGRLYLAAAQDLQVSGRQSNAQYQYTLLSDNAQALYAFTPKLVDALAHSSVLTDVNSDLATEGARDLSGDRSRYNRSSRHYAAADRQYALRCIRAAASIGHLQRYQPVPRRYGNRSALHAVPRVAP